MKKPHIIIFNPDQWRGDSLGHLGNKAVATPNIDKIVSKMPFHFRTHFAKILSVHQAVVVL